MKKYIIAVFCTAAIFFSCNDQIPEGVNADDVTFRIVPSAIMATSPDAHTIIIVEGNTVSAIDTRTDETKVVFRSDRPVEIHAVSNNGIMLGSYIVDDDGDGIIDDGDDYDDEAETRAGVGVGSGFYIENGQIKRPTLPPGFDGEELVISDISADGSVMVGYALHSDGLTKGIRWDNGTPTALDGPTDDRFADDEIDVLGVMPEAVSPDGRIIVGRAWCGNDNQGLYWKDGRWKWLGHVVEREVSPDPEAPDEKEKRRFISRVNPRQAGLFSGNSRYSAVGFGVWGMGYWGMMTLTAPAIFDFETEKLAVMDAKGSGMPTFASDGGILAYRSSQLTEGYLWQPGEFTGGASVTGIEKVARGYIERMFGGIYIGPCVSVQRLVGNKLVIGTFFSPQAELHIPFYARVD